MSEARGVQGKGRVGLLSHENEGPSGSQGRWDRGWGASGVELRKAEWSNRRKNWKKLHIAKGAGAARTKQRAEDEELQVDGRTAEQLRSGDS